MTERELQKYKHLEKGYVMHNYQHTVANHIIDNLFCGIFLDMGLGKTISTLTAIKWLMYDELEINSVLVIAPKKVAGHVWTTEIAEWAHTHNMTTSIIAGTEKERKAALAKKADIHLIGRDNIVWLCGQYGGSMLPYDMLVIDESSSFKNPKTQRFKSLRKVQPSFKRVAILTGTPVPNSLLDLWPQLYLLDRGERLGKFITNFRDNHFIRGYNGWGYTVRKDSEEVIHKAISDICISMKKEDYLELPGVVEVDVIIKFTEDLKAQYEQFKKDKIFEILDAENQDPDEEITISALNAAALSNKLLQFANGAIYDDDKNYHTIHDLKINEVKDIIENANGHSVLIAYSYKHDLHRLKEGLAKYKPQELKNGKDIDNWNASKTQVLLMHPASGGHGLNLQSGGNIIVWFGQTWSSELYSQFNARLDRQGKTEVTIIHRLIVEGTMDVRAVNVVKNKLKGQDGLMAAVKAEVDKYKKLWSST